MCNLSQYLYKFTASSFMLQPQAQSVTVKPSDFTLVLGFSWRPVR